ncbi:MAG: flagellar motor protein MotB [Alphaproteobacteria bacterium]|nr:flagellar motor protein MotB [Alphaproteobacteria bacterium]
MADQEAIIIKKIKKGGHGGHHGGAWKLAYADFVTAMMAFFLLLWLLNVTTEEQKNGIADYFTPASVSQSRSGAEGILAGQSLSLDGAKLGQGPAAEISVQKQSMVDDVLREREEQRLKETAEEIKEKIEQDRELAKIKDSVMLDVTPDGLRITITDADKEPMFSLGSARMSDRTRGIVRQIANAVQELPNKVSIEGHTDAKPFRTRDGYSNWELSSDRANATRRALVDAGVPFERVIQVIGRAEREPLLPEDPDNGRNRRISITMLREIAAKPTITVDQRVLAPNFGPANAAGGTRR